MGRTATGDKSDCCDRAASGQSITNIDVVVVIIIITWEIMPFIYGSSDFAMVITVVLRQAGGIVAWLMILGINKEILLVIFLFVCALLIMYYYYY
jgi:hypothetical protein